MDLQHNTLTGQTTNYLINFFISAVKPIVGCAARHLCKGLAAKERTVLDKRALETITRGTENGVQYSHR